MNNNIHYEKGSIHKDNHQETHIQINGNISEEMFEKNSHKFFWRLGYGYKGLEEELSNRLGVKCVISVRQKPL